MRTTIEITDEQRARLLEIAARRGLKGFSPVVREAIDRYLVHLEDDRDRRLAALDARGTLSGEDAEALRDSVASLRGRWR